MSVRALDERREIDVKGSCNSSHIVDRNVSLGPLDGPDIGAMQSAKLSKPLLRNALLGANAANVGGEHTPSCLKAWWHVGSKLAVA